MSPSTASSNWLQLQKKIKPAHPKRKKPRPSTSDARAPSPSAASQSSSHMRGAEEERVEACPSTSAAENTPKALRKMVEGHVQFTEKQRLPGKFLALDCEMVGVGLDGSESSLARVSIVNFYGATILDAFVKQRERVVDYRTQWSGVRPADMVNAKPFEEVQKQVADLLEGRILVGHAVHNDLKALLLSHPFPLTRDTQVLAYKGKVTKSKRIALRNLVKQELEGMEIQAGEHSSVTDARATMAVYRLHKKEWDKLLGAFAHADAKLGSSSSSTGKRKASELDSDDSDEEASDHDDSNPDAKTTNKKKKPKVVGAGKGKVPGPEGRKGVSSGLATVVHRGGVKVKTGKGSAAGSAKGRGGGGGDQEKGSWWAKLPSSGGGSGAKKGSMTLKL